MSFGEPPRPRPWQLDSHSQPDEPTFSPGGWILVGLFVQIAAGFALGAFLQGDPPATGLLITFFALATVGWIVLLIGIRAKGVQVGMRS